jgi:hypothetical protein
MAASTIPPLSVWPCGTPFGNTQEGTELLESAKDRLLGRDTTARQGEPVFSPALSPSAFCHLTAEAKGDVYSGVLAPRLGTPFLEVAKRDGEQVWAMPRAHPCGLQSLALDEIRQHRSTDGESSAPPFLSSQEVYVFAACVKLRFQIDDLVQTVLKLDSQMIPIP